MALHRRYVLSLASQLAARTTVQASELTEGFTALRSNSSQYCSTSQSDPFIGLSGSTLKRLLCCCAHPAKVHRVQGESQTDGCVSFVRSHGFRAPQQLRTHDVTARSADLFIYEGPLSKAVKNLKRLSIVSCALSVLGSPILIWGVADAMPLAAQVSIAATIGGFGVFTTSLLHWFTSPYVHRLEYDRHTGTVAVETMSIVAQLQRTRFHEAEVQYPDTIRPQVTFQVQGKFFFLDADNFKDKELLHRLTPPDPAAATDSLSSQ